MPDSTKSQQPKLLDQVRQVLRLHHYSIHTERSYVDWIVRSFPRGPVSSSSPPKPRSNRRVPWTISALDLHPSQSA